MNAAAPYTATTGGTLRGELRVHEPLSRHTSWRVGGPADRYYKPADADDLRAFLSRLPAGEPLLWLGLGSNLLVRDAGWRGTAVTVHGVLESVDRLDTLTVRADAGVHCARLAKLLAGWGLAGGEFLAGIPGTLGGALAMNAGAWGGETWDVVTAVTMVDRAGGLQQLTPRDFSIAYRSVTGPQPDLWFVAADLRLTEDADGGAAERIRAMLAERKASQPVGRPSCGSVFRNPPGDHAARLIEVAGLKGRAIGDAEVSTKHANFIINRGNARAADIEALIGEVRLAVQARFGVELLAEVRVVGEAA